MKLRRIVAVTMVTAFLFIIFIVPSSAASDSTFYDYWSEGYFIPSPDYPNRESLPYGNDTVIYEVELYGDESNIAKRCRYYLKRDLYSGSGLSAFNGVSFVFGDNEASGSSNRCEILAASPYELYCQDYWYDLNTGSILAWGSVQDSTYYKTENGKTYNMIVHQGSVSSTYSAGSYTGAVFGSDPCYYGGRDFNAILNAGLASSIPSDQFVRYTQRYWIVASTKSYPTSDVISSSNISNAIDEGNEKIINQLKEESQKQITAINNLGNKIENAITEAVDDIINAGSDMPTLNTDNEWMNDSLTKVNEWLSQLEGFEQQMQDAEAENSENMAEAKSFINGFFGAVPTPIISVLTLILVIIVAVKVVGR